MQQPINIAHLEHNSCFGCGHENPHGLKIAVYHHDNDSRKLRAELRPNEHTTGFPGITHGGALYTAMDCLCAWTSTILRDERAIWILGTATITYRSPMPASGVIQLESSIVNEKGEWRPMEIAVTARSESGTVYAEGSFANVPLEVERFKALVGISELPSGWQTLLDAKGDTKP